MLKRPLWLCLSICMLHLMTMHGQSSAHITVTFDDTPMMEALDSVAAHFGKTAAYDADLLSAYRTSVSIEMATLDEALDLLLTPQLLTYQTGTDGQLMVRRIATRDVIEDFEIRGWVEDEGGEGLAYAHVTIAGSTYETFTDSLGRFHLKIRARPTEIVLILVDLLGYEDATIPHKVTSTSSVPILLTTQPEFIDAIIIQQQSSPVGIRRDQRAYDASIDSAEHWLSDNVGKNFFRGLQLYPSVTATNDIQPGLRIRGGDADETLVFLDGIPLYRADHYHGLFSTVHTSSLSAIHLYHHAFPASFGGHTSGFVDLESLDLRQLSSPSLALSAGSLTSDATMKVPLSKTLQFMASGRTTTSEIAGVGGADEVRARTARRDLEDRSVETVEIEPALRFYDIQAQLQWQIRPRHQLSLHYLQSADDYRYEFEQAREIYPRNRPDQDPLIQEHIYEEETQWDNRSIGLNYTFNIDDARTLHLTAARSWLSDDFSSFHENEIETPDGEEESLRQSLLTFHNELNTQRIDASYRHQIHLHTSYMVGFDLNRYDVNTDFSFDENQLLEQEQTSSLYGVYGQFDHRLTKRAYVSLGLRAQRYSKYDDIDLSPRILIGYEASARVTINASFGRYYQYLQRRDQDTQFGRTIDYWLMAQGRRVPVSTSNHYTVGAKWTHPWFVMSTELFAKYTDGVYRSVLRDFIHPDNRPPGPPGPPSARPPRELLGEQRVLGVDLLLKKDMKGYSTWLAYTLSWNEHRFEALNDGNYFAANGDTRHQLKWTNLLRLHDNWSLQLNYVYGSGRNYTDIAENIIGDRQEIRPLAPIEDLQDRLPDYHRVDLGVSYRFTLKKLPCQIGLNIHNLLDQNNVLYREYIYKYRERAQDQEVLVGADLEQLGRTPQLYFSVRF